MQRFQFSAKADRPNNFRPIFLFSRVCKCSFTYLSGLTCYVYARIILRLPHFRKNAWDFAEKISMEMMKLPLCKASKLAPSQIYRAPYHSKPHRSIPSLNPRYEFTGLGFISENSIRVLRSFEFSLPKNSPPFCENRALQFQFFRLPSLSI